MAGLKCWADKACQGVGRHIRATLPLALDTGRTARTALVSWEAVGTALGRTRQSAYERYARHVTD
ncbi:hypothetical protein ADK52_12120 [Streptomyces sp. WM6372]|uniref:hypothetical protein n=1 Tax=Streptomyces sp. WM6372 TaxID=1415555 RepID=UPI0006AE5126|nr:hypothetical protein ADK52_12120 [Streptomyces sp. WM6372]